VGSLARVPFTVEGHAIEREHVPLAQFRFASSGYFETLRIPLLRGRLFSDRDSAGTTPVAIVNQALAERWLDAIDPIGARLLVDDNDGAPRPVEVVGVVGNVRQIALDDREPTWDLYLPYAQIHADTVGGAVANLHWMARTAGDPMTIAEAFVRELGRVDPDVIASPIRPLTAQLSESLAPRRFSVSLMAAFGAAALALAVTGIHAVVLYTVSQRGREIGIRIALGARASHVTSLVVSEGARFILAGLVAGTAMGVGSARLLSSMLFGLPAVDVATIVQVAAAVIVAALLACAIPTVRALRLGSSALARW
jgi:hypothetical protein